MTLTVVIGVLAALAAFGFRQAIWRYGENKRQNGTAGPMTHNLFGPDKKDGTI